MGGEYLLEHVNAVQVSSILASQHEI